MLKAKLVLAALISILPINLLRVAWLPPDGIHGQRAHRFRDGDRRFGSAHQVL